MLDWSEALTEQLAVICTVSSLDHIFLEVSELSILSEVLKILAWFSIWKVYSFQNQVLLPFIV